MSSKDEKISWDKSHHSIFENFALDLIDFMETNKLPAYGDQDLNYCLELQQKRLINKKMTMKYNIIPRGLFADGGGMGKSWSDEHYVSNMEYRTCKLIRTFYRDQKKVYNKKQDTIFYQIITNVYNRDIVGSDLYTCPNCAAISKISALRQGCPYCGTFFNMTDLFPKVTNFFFVEDSGGTGKELKYSIGKVIALCALPCIIGYTIYFHNNAMAGEGLIFSIIRGILSGTLLGAITGYFLWAMAQVVTLFIKAGKSMPMVINATGSGKRFVDQMKQYSPEFSYEYFSDKAVSILKMIIFSDDAGELPNYVGEPLGNIFSDIVESAYTGAVALKQFSVKNDYCYVVVDVYMENIYDKGKRIYKKNEKIRMYLCKRVNKVINYHFSIMKIQCKGCGGNFDATKRRTCPSCGKRYEIEDDDWGVTKIQKR